MYLIRVTKKNSLIGFIFIIACLIFFACKKNDSNDLEAFVPNKYSSATEILKSLDKSELKQLIANKDEAAVDKVMGSLAKNIVAYLHDKYNLDLRRDLNEDKRSILVLGVFYAAKESSLTSLHYDKNNSQSPINTLNPDDSTNSPIDSSILIHPALGYSSDIGDPNFSVEMASNPTFDCFLTVVSGIIGIRDIQSLYKDFVAGVGAETIIASMRLMFKRVATVFTIAVAVYETGECLGWW
jgi:hypothetical protein